MERDEHSEYSSTKKNKNLKFTAWFKEKLGWWSTFETGILQKWKYLFSSSTKWPYWLESWEAVSSHHMTLIAMCVRAGASVHAHVFGVQWCLRERTSDRATGPTARNRGEVDKLRIAEGRCQRGDITLHNTPTQTGLAITRYVSDISMQIK